MVVQIKELARYLRFGLSSWEEVSRIPARFYAEGRVRGRWV